MLDMLTFSRWWIQKGSYDPANLYTFLASRLAIHNEVMESLRVASGNSGKDKFVHTSIDHPELSFT